MSNFLKDESGQDIIEYSLLLVFVGLVSLAVFASIGGMPNFWGEIDGVLAQATHHSPAVASALAAVPVRPTEAILWSVALILLVAFAIVRHRRKWHR